MRENHTETEECCDVCNIESLEGEGGEKGKVGEEGQEAQESEAWRDEEVVVSSGAGEWSALDYYRLAHGFD